MELKICHLYPDILNLYGDRGNIVSMENRLRWRGISVETQGVSMHEKLCANDFDLFFIGGGQMSIQDPLLLDFTEKSKELSAAAEDGRVLLAIDSGYQMLGQYMRDTDGIQHDLSGILNVYTVESKKRMTGDCMFSWEKDKTVKVVGFENHSGKTYLGSGIAPLGQMLVGHGNNGEDGTEGARYKNVFASYLHGSLLPKNPVLCDDILRTALERKYGTVELPPLDDIFENKAHDFMVNRLTK